MLSIQYRFFIALGLSMSVAAVTLMLYFNLQKNFIFSSSQKPIARMSRIVNESLKKQSGHLIWEELEKDDFIYAGESIRTMENSVAHIELLKEGSIIKIDPESVIVLDLLNDSIQLDFLKGSLVIENSPVAKSGTNQIILKSDGKSQVLDGKEINLSKDEKSGLTLESIFKLKFPNGNSDYIYTENDSENIEFIFDSKENLIDAELWLGNKRSNLKFLQKINNIKLGENRILLDVPTGSHFWKIKTNKNKSDLESGVSFFTIKKIMKPIAVFPQSDSEILKNNDQQITSFTWANKQSSKLQKIELSVDPEFKTLVASSEWGALSQWDYTLKDESTYYWRILTDINKKIFKSNIFNFKYASLENIKSDKIDKIKIDLIKPLQPVYEFTKPVITIPIAWRSFKGIDLKFEVRIKDLISKKEEINYVSDFNYLFESDVTSDFELTIKGTSSGQLIIEPLNHLIFKTVYPILPAAPQLIGVKNEGEINADLKGDLKIKWDQINKIKKYYLEFYKEGKKIKSVYVNSTNYEIKKMNPGQYKIKIYSVDFLNRNSGQPNLYNLIVPNQSDAEAPKLKPIKIR